VLVWHRRAGKTVYAINWLLRQVLECQSPNARGAYLSPQFKQSKRIAWSMLKDFTRPIPGCRYLEQELRCLLPGGREIWLLGADNPDALRGIYLDACVLDEVAQMAPRTWGEVIRPALSDLGREGQALMIGTPFGMANEFHRFFELAADTPGWTRSLLTVHDTGAIAPAEIEALQRETRPEEWQQEYLCSFSAAIRGAFYAREMQDAEQQGRISAVPRDPLLPVHTSWDLGMANRTVVWLLQCHGAQVRAIGCRAYAGTGLPDIVADLRSLGYTWGRHYAPHDAKVRELGSGKSRQEIAQALGMNWEIVPEVGLQSGIEATRALLPRMWFDREACADGISALQLYRTEWDDELRVFSSKPLHDWTSDFSDSLRMFAVGSQGKEPGREPIRYRDKVVA
jgi:hypothetical protein